MRSPTLLLLLVFLSACGGKTKTAEDSNNTPTPQQPVPNLPGNQQPGVVAGTTITFRQDVTVAVFDSGVDTTQQILNSQIWQNTREAAGNLVDDDRNTYVDDLQGWNFIDNNNTVFDTRSFLRTPTDVIRFMHLGALVDTGTTLSVDDRNWLATKSRDINYLDQVSIYSTLSHGTHVSGIITKSNTRARILPIKILATGTTSENIDANFARFMTRSVLGGIQGTSTGIGDAVRYASAQGALVANGSFSFGEDDLRKSLAQLNGLNISAMDSLVGTAFAKISDTLSREIGQAANTVFVFAAGNQAANNDVLQRLPANTRQHNSITVAATNGRQSLARFSNYGAARVDVAAPGVAIVSTMPGNQSVEMSGTSMAAPYVARVASQIRSINPRLTVADTKRMILETVDVKEFLRGKVATSGIVNPLRAVAAAELSHTLSVSAAIQEARAKVGDMSAD